MPQPDRGTKSRLPLVIAGVILAIPVILPLLVSTYAKTDPKLGGFPFYFWWQFALIVVSGICTIIGYRIVVGHDNRSDDARSRGERA